MSQTMHDPVYFAFGLHAHQPVGNFGHVFEEHLRDVYEPFLTRALEGDLFPLTLHISGPLLDWLETNSPSYLDLVGRLAADGKLELLLAGYYEPILPSLLREDRIEQIGWMKDALQSRFGVNASGLWLTERVWEPDLAGDLADAGVEYVLVDDRHFVAAGFAREDLPLTFWGETWLGGVGGLLLKRPLFYDNYRTGKLYREFESIKEIGVKKLKVYQKESIRIFSSCLERKDFTMSRFSDLSNHFLNSSKSCSSTSNGS